MITTDKPILCIDFGTTNSSACWVQDGRITPVPLENGAPTIPSAIFFSAERPEILFGSAAIREYELETHGRLMKSLKSVLSSSLINESTEISGGYVEYRQITYKRVIELFMSHIKHMAERHTGGAVSQAVLGRPVHFVDDNELRDKETEKTLAGIANEVGFTGVNFQYEPVAAALDYEVALKEDRIVLIVDIGGGTSDFSLLHVGPSFRNDKDRSNSVIGTAGVHIAGTDFDQFISLSTAMKTLGLGSIGKSGRKLPIRPYSILSTWHEINRLYSRVEISRIRELKHEFADQKMHERLMRSLQKKLGHEILGAVESAKETVSEGGSVHIDLGFVESHLKARLTELTLSRAISSGTSRIVNCAEELVRSSAIAKADITAVYFTGGSTAIRYLRRQFQKAFPASEFIVGEKFVSVSQGLGVSTLKENWIAS